MLIQNKFGVEVDTKNMSEAELEEVRNDALKLLSELNHEFKMRKIAAHKHCSSKNVTTPANI